MKKLLHAAVVSGALVLCLGFAAAQAQESLSASDAENSNLWFVELSGKPAADGGSVSSAKNEKKAFRSAAAAAGISFVERQAYDVLFNGLAIQVNSTDLQKIKGLSGVKALWPIETVSIPDPEDGSGSAPNLETAIAMTGANIAHTSLGITGAGVRVAVMDTGIDYDHADFGGDGTARSNSNQFPNSRVVAGFDFVGDAFTGGNTPVPDPFPDDCAAHGSHVAGIVGANGGAVGVAPDVVFGAYRVFGCAGSTTSDIMLAAMERALADDMDVLNMSIGARAQWPQYPTAVAATRLLKKGMVVVASIGNNGPQAGVPDGPYAVGAPGVGADVIGVASFDNTHVAQRAFSVSPDNKLVGFNQATAAAPAPTSGSSQLSRTGTTTTVDDGCPPWDAANFAAPAWPGGAWLPAGSHTGKAVLIRRGTCSFYAKSRNALQAGAASVVIYNNVAGAAQTITVAPSFPNTPTITIPVVSITAADGALIDGRIAGGATSLTWGTETITTPLATAGLISAFSSIGMAADLTLKPDIGAPGGSIFSTIPLELGAYGQNSGTSMSSPHVAGAVALLLQGAPGISPSAVRARLQNSADPTVWFGNPPAGLLEVVHRQGAGLVDIDDAITATVDVTPGKLSLGESQAGPQTRTLTIRNRGSSAVTFDLSRVDAVGTGPKSLTTYENVSYFAAATTASFSPASVAVPAGATRTVDVTITAHPGAPDRSQYGGYVVLTPQGGGKTYRVPFAGFKGDYQTVPTLTPTVFGFPWLAKLSGTTLTNQPAGATYTMIGDDVPQFLAHFDHHVQYYEFRITNAATGQPLHPVFSNFDEDEFVGRNLTATGFFVFAWDGTRAHSNGNNNLRKVVPDGQYIVQLRVLKALGDANNAAHWETWNSPVVTIDRP